MYISDTVNNIVLRNMLCLHRLPCCKVGWSIGKPNFPLIKNTIYFKNQYSQEVVQKKISSPNL